MTTIAIPTYSFARGLSGSFVRNHFYGDGTEFSGPTPFEIPESVALMVDDQKNLELKLTYSDHEGPETHARDALADRSAIAILGSVSKKILQLTFFCPVDKHLASGFAFDEAVIASSGTQLPKRAEASFKRNAAVVHSILASTPEEILNQLRLLTAHDVAYAADSSRA